VVLLLAGVVLAAAFRITSGSEHRAYAMGSAPPVAVHVDEGQGYRLATPGGVRTALARGISQLPGKDGAPAHLALDCTWSVGGGPGQALTVVAEQVDSKAVNAVATFTAPVSGALLVSCAGLGPTYIAGPGSSDPAGWLLLGAVIALALGAGIGLSALRAALATQPPAARPQPQAPPQQAEPV
jgi:hypothetical protein